MPAAVAIPLASPLLAVRNDTRTRQCHKQQHQASEHNVILTFHAGTIKKLFDDLDPGLWLNTIKADQ